MAGIFAPQTAPDGYIDYVGTGLTLRRASLRANARQVNTLRPHVVEMSKRYPTLDLPVELVHGDTDDTVPLDIHSQPLSALLPDANLTVLPGIGHMPHHVAPEAVTAAIDRAARRAAPAPPPCPRPAPAPRSRPFRTRPRGRSAQRIQTRWRNGSASHGGTAVEAEIGHSVTRF